MPGYSPRNAFFILIKNRFMVLMIIGCGIAAQPAKLAQQFLLIIGQVCWRYDRNFHMLIALTVAAQM